MRKAVYSIEIDGQDVSSAFHPLLISLEIDLFDGGETDRVTVALDDTGGQIQLPRAGASILEAFVLAVYLEETAQRQYMALQVGTPRVLDATEISTIGANLWKPNLLQKVWDFHHAKIGRRA